MDTVIQFTPAQLIGIAGAIITISTAIGVLINLINKAREPERKQDERIKACEDRLDKIDGKLANDDKRLKAIGEGNKITQTALLALLKHALNGNDTQALKDAEKDLEEYLINK